MKHLRKTLALILALALCAGFCAFPALAAGTEPPKQEINGRLNASDLIDGAAVVLTGDTVLTLDTVRSVFSISCNGRSPMSDGEDTFSLTIQGQATLTAASISVDTLVLESGTVNLEVGNTEEDFRAVNLSAYQIIVNGGELCNLGVNTGSSMVVSSLVVNSGRVDMRNLFAAICADKMEVSGGEVYAEGGFTAICGSDSWAGLISGCKLSVSGGSVESKGVPVSEDGWTIGAALNSLTVTGGTFAAEGTVSAVNCWDAPIVLGNGVTLASPVGAYVSAEKTDSEKAINGWSGYSVLNADGTRATELVIKAPAPTVAGFSDVYTTDYYADAVTWAATHEPVITLGYGGGVFGGGDGVKRAQAVTFLWRAAGEPEPETTTNPFSDVKESEYYYKPVLWAAENGITLGNGDGTFGPDSNVTRLQMLTFMARTAGVDVSGANWVKIAEDWAAENGLSDGIPGVVDNGADCPRSDVVYYLWKQLA